MKLQIILFLFSSVTIVSCGNRAEQDFEKKKRIAICTKARPGGDKYEVSLFDDSTFYLKGSSLGSSYGRFKIQSSRYYFITTEGKNYLCEFYYCDSLKNKLWSPKNCEEDYMKIEFAN